MASKVAPPKSTGGGGFVFEDHVCAWLLACMLADEPPLDASLGRLERLDFQTKPDGWILDDALLTLAQGDARSRCALSIKSNPQFQGYAVPADFVEEVWEQFLRVGSTVFDPSTDFLGLVTAPVDREVKAAVEGIIGKAIAEDPTILPSRLATSGWANDAERGLFDSCACPTALAGKHNVTAADTGRLLRRLRFLQHDFDATTSESKNAATRLCRATLRSGDLEEATKLWEALVRIAAELRPKAGFIARPALLDRLRTRFHLSDRPDHRTDWLRLLELSRGAASQVNDEIGGRVRLGRDAEVDSFERALEGTRGLVVIGPSGTGKSALARRWFERRLAQGKKALWFDGRSFERADFAAFESDLRLTHTLAEIVASVPDRDVVLFLDGLDRIYHPPAFRLLSNLVRLLEFDRGAGTWRLVVTSQRQEWSRFQDSLLQAGIRASTWQTVELTAFDLAALDEVGRAFPAVARLLRQRNLGPILGNLKILDMVARRSSAGESIETLKWVGESSVAAWFWDAEVARGGNGPVRARFARLLAERQADMLRSAIPPDEFRVADLQPLGELTIDRVCRQAPDEQVAFAHDLYGDWARLRILASRTNDELALFLKNRLASPLWHRAVRLLGLHFLEHLGDVERWRSALRAFGTDDDGVAHDLLLESPVFAADPARLLEFIVPDLLESDGRLLRRFLTRFLAYATLPDPRIAAIAKAEGADDAVTRARYRYLNWPYWPAVLRFLHAHSADVVGASPVETARVVDLWLKHMPVERKLLRREAGELALALGKRARQARESYTGDDYQNRGLYYRVALVAAHELPNEVAAFAVEAAERLPDEPVEKTEPTPDTALLPKSLVFDTRFDPDEPAPEPWPDGPRRRVDKEFRTAAVEGSALIPLMRVRPAIAREVALAVLIKPRRRLGWHNHWYERTELDVDSGHRWHPALYVHGPFLAFLSINFAEGLELIARLVDFAAERWNDYTSADADEAARRASESDVDTSGLEHLVRDWSRPPSTFAIDLGDERRELRGDARVYGWSAGLGNPPKAVVAALMALEQYFYAALDEKKSIDDEIRLVLARARSVAFVKVLCDIGKRERTLFEGPLRPLLTIPEVYHWDIGANVHDRTHLMIGAPMQGAWFVKLAHEFHSLEHRNIDLRTLAMLLLFNRPAMREFFESARTAWELRRKASADDPLHTFIEQLVISFDLRNYEAQEDPEHGAILVNVRAQQHDRERAEERRTWEEGVLVTSLPMRCRQMIDDAKPIAPEAIETFWQQLRHIDEKFGQGGADADEYGRGPDYAVNAVAGGIAVLVRLHSAWLAEVPEREEWCRARIQKIVLEPPAGTEFDTPESVSTWTWDCFAAEALPIFWARNPSDQVMRQLIARLVFAPHYVAVEILFRRCAEHRSSHRLDFARLRRLAFECAYLRDRAMFLQHSRKASGRIAEEDIQKLGDTVNPWAEERADAFVRATSEPRWERWAELDTDLFRDIDESRRAWNRDGHLDLHMIRAAHTWMPALASALDAEERGEWLAFWVEALAFVLRRAGTAKRDHNHPFEDEQWILSRTAAALLEMTAREDPKALWWAVVGLPAEAHDWPEDFLQAFHRTALASEPVPEGYTSGLRAIMWQVLPADTTPTTKWPWHEEVWDALVGIDGVTQSYWAPRHASLVASLSDVFERWWEKAPAYGRRVALFARWLERSAASRIRLRAIIWLERRLTADANRAFDREDLSEAIASLLAATWQHDEACLRADARAFGAFRNLLKVLADDQNELALDLLGRIGGLE